MVQSIDLWVVQKTNAAMFLQVLRADGIWGALRRSDPGLIAIDVLQSRQRSRVFVTLAFWTDADAYVSSAHSGTCSAVMRILTELATWNHALGLFEFPPRAREEMKIPNLSLPRDLA
jgi:hypothetical protein